MELKVIDSHTRCVIDLIRTYTYAQYVDEFVGEGSFQINVPYNDLAVPYLVFGNFIIFNKDVIGIIKDVEDSQEEMNEIIVKGKLSNHLLAYRCIPFTEKHKGTITDIARYLVDEHFINPRNEVRDVSFIRLATDEKYIPESEEINLCETGETVRATISSMFLPYGFGFELHGIVQDIDEKNGRLNNIPYFEFRVLKPVDRTIRNELGNEPVVFAFQLNNVSRLDLVNDGSSYASTALVAGEGKGFNRKLIEAGDLEARELDRIEIYVDARDVQSSDNQTEEDLISTMKQRGLEKLQEHIKFITFDATVLIEGNNVFQYGRDFTKGDYVSVINDKTGEIFDLQVASVTMTTLNGIEHFDITFGIDEVSMDSLTSSGSHINGDYGGSGSDGETINKVYCEWNKETDGDYGFEKKNDNKWISTNQKINNSICTSAWSIDIPYGGAKYLISWSVSSEVNKDKFLISIDGETKVNDVSGKKADTFSGEFEQGRHILVASYKKDTSVDANDDEAWLILNDVLSTDAVVSTNIWRPTVKVDGYVEWELSKSNEPPTPVNIKGPEGPEGIQGPKGPKGEMGLSAYDIAVLQGYKGTSEEWIASLHGKDGKSGKDGLDGQNGSDGLDGLNGLSAYEIALEEGFVGTEKEWLESLKGPKGDAGGYVDADVFLTEEEIKENIESGNLVDALFIKEILEKGLGGGSNVYVLNYQDSMDYLESEIEGEPSGGELVSGTDVMDYDESLEFLNSES